MGNAEAFVHVVAGLVSIGITLFAFWHLYGGELRRWWRAHQARAREKWEDARAWRNEWRHVWQIEASGADG